MSALLSTIGNTPLVELDGVCENAVLLAKLEGRNPGGSAKDRVALSIIEDAGQRGALRPGGTVVESTSGNTGVGLALVCAARGYHAILTMPDSMSQERRKLLAGLGARLVLTPGCDGMAGALTAAEQLCKTMPNSVMANQFSNPANPLAHYRTTGPEIWAQAGGRVDAFVAGVGTGGTITGVGRYLKEQNPSAYLLAVEPAESPLLSRGWAGPHGIQGIGANFVPEALDRSLLDEILPIETKRAIDAARALMRGCGLLCGISSGAAFAAALALASRPAWAGKRIVVLLPDTGERYLSTALFCEA